MVNAFSCASIKPYYIIYAAKCESMNGKQIKDSFLEHIVEQITAKYHIDVKSLYLFSKTSMTFPRGSSLNVNGFNVETNKIAAGE